MHALFSTTPQIKTFDDQGSWSLDRSPLIWPGDMRKKQVLNRRVILPDLLMNLLDSDEHYWTTNLLAPQDKMSFHSRHLGSILVRIVCDDPFVDLSLKPWNCKPLKLTRAQMMEHKN